MKSPEDRDSTLLQMSVFEDMANIIAELIKRVKRNEKANKYGF
jgi:hypothetical protein